MSDGKKIKILHTSDFHIGISSWDRPDAATGMSSRYLESANTLSKIREIAQTEQCDLVLITGDIFHRRNPQPHENNLLAKFLIELKSIDIPVAIIRGNHELPRISGGEHAIGIYRTLNIPGVYIIDRDKPVRIATRNGPLQIGGIPYPTRQDAIEVLGEDFEPNAENWTKYFEKTLDGLSKQLDNSIPVLLAMHVYVSGASIATNYLPHSQGEPIAMLSTLGHEEFDYVGLGHIHGYQSLELGMGRKAIYAGSTVKTSFAEEKQQKGVVIAEIQKGQAAKHRFFPLDTVRNMVTIEADITGDTDIANQVRRAMMGKKIDDAIVRVYYKTERSKPPIKRAEFNEIMPNAYRIIPIRNIASEEIESDIISKLSTAEPIAELSVYIDSIGSYGDRKKELLKLAEEILESRETDQLFPNEEVE